MIRSIVAAVATTTLLATAVPAGQAFAAGPEGKAGQANCIKTVLDLPADSVPGSSVARTADPSGRYILGEANREGRQHGQAVLWVDGLPRWLGTSRAGGESFGYSVIKGGFVLGTTYGVDGDDYWIYSVATDSYRILDLPSTLKYPEFTAMNKNQDIVGTTYDETLGEHVPFVWPAGGQPKRLPLPVGATTEGIDDISDEGLVIARLVPAGSFVSTSYLWKNAIVEPTRLPGVDQKTVWARDIEGDWIAGGENDSDDVTGLLWNTKNPKITQLEEGVVDLNTSLDAVTAGAFGPFGDYPSMIIRSDGAKITFPNGTLLSHIFERDTKWTAAGEDVSTGTPVPVLYACK
jgi:hypothetical protein